MAAASLNTWIALLSMLPLNHKKVMLTSPKSSDDLVPVRCAVDNPITESDVDITSKMQEPKNKNTIEYRELLSSEALSCVRVYQERVLKWIMIGEVHEYSAYSMSSLWIKNKEATLPEQQ